MGTSATEPAKIPLPKPGKRQTFEKAVAETMKQYQKTLRKLARYDTGEDDESKKPDDR